MLALFSSAPPFVWVSLLLLTFLLRLPSFHPDFVAADEALYLEGARQMLDGALLYRDVWDHRPPVPYFLYTAFAFVFNDGALYALRFFSVFYIFLTGLSISYLLYEYRFTQRFEFYPAFIYIFISSTPWYAQELNAELILALPAVWALMLLIRRTVDDKKVQDDMFWIGFLCGLCVLTKFQGGAVFIAVLIGYYAVGRFIAGEFITLITGFFIPLSAVFVYFYFHHALNDLQDKLLLYNLDYIGGLYHPTEIPSWRGALEYFKHWGPILVAGFTGFFMLRVGSVKYTIKQRKIELIFGVWFVAALLFVLLGGGRFYLHYLYLLSPPLIFYIAVYYKQAKSAFWKYFISFSSFIFPAFTYIIFFICINPILYEKVRVYINKSGWLSELYVSLNGNKDIYLLRAELNKLKPDATLWVTDYQPELYIRLQRRCGIKYLNFSMAYHKMNWLKANVRQGRLISNEESLENTYRTFYIEKPDVILDETNIFREIKDKIPLLLQEYRFKKVGKYNVYIRTPHS